ncbi:ras and EF-hand domain-containing protein isoform X3 [Perognathus longimembris pacificus]|uniref:ras and EF-hand domain-containing protein isoform X3 n=1 Tax=Perognathus longimembris pacificus TaxID=214514 RepID=UPI002019A9E3|nr:ras and EF-hand domain-containing protein isoform X3 [Perognathus longimembris pacificus]
MGITAASSPALEGRSQILREGGPCCLRGAHSVEGRCSCAVWSPGQGRTLPLWHSRGPQERGGSSPCARLPVASPDALPLPDITASGQTSWASRSCPGSGPEQVALHSPARSCRVSALSPRHCPRAGGMEADGEPEELARLHSVFTACDANRSGRLEREEFGALCTELRVRPADAEAVFQRLDADRDGAITFQEFARGFRGARRRTWGPRASVPAAAAPGLEPRDSEEEEDEEGAAGDQDWVGDLDAPWSPARSGGRAWQDFQGRLGDEAKFIPRAQDKAAMQLSELEEEMDQRIQAVEHKTRKDEKRKAEEALSDLRRQYETEVGDLQVTIKKLKKLEEQSKHISQKEDVAALKKQIYDLSMENQKVKKELLEAHTNIAFLQSELDALKSDYANQSLNSERDLEIIREYTEDRNSLERQIEILQTANRKLHDSNDGLRSALENTYSKFNRSLRINNISPGNTISRSSPKFNGHSPQPVGYDRSSRSSYVDEDCDSLALCDPMQRMNYEVDSLPESCFDSGLSTLRDSNEYDSEMEYKHQKMFQSSHGAQESFGGDASDTDVPDIRDEETYDSEDVASVLDLKPQGSVCEGSTGSSSRKPILALSPQIDMADDNSKPLSTQKAYKIVLAGDAAVGKSSFLMRLCKNEFRGNTSATLGVDFQTKTLIVDGEQTILQLWDTAGQERFRSIAKSYFRKADGVLLLYDVTCEKSFLNVREWVDMVEDATHETIPIMLVGNKADLRDTAAAEGQKCVQGYFGEKLAMTYGALFCETSAKDGSNVVEAVLHLAREVKKRTEDDDSKSITNLAGTGSKKSIQMKNCCNG